MIEEEIELQEKKKKICLRDEFGCHNINEPINFR